MDTSESLHLYIPGYAKKTSSKFRYSTVKIAKRYSDARQLCFYLPHNMVHCYIQDVTSTFLLIALPPILKQKSTEFITLIF